MNEIILKAKNRQELDLMIKKSITLQEDETVKVNVIKEPGKFLFFNFPGTYKIQILKKSELKKAERTEKPEVKKVREEKKEFPKKQYESREKKPAKENKENKETMADTNIPKIRSFMKEFIVKTKLNLKIVKIEKKNDMYVVNLDGKDIRYLIGEKGSTLNNFEYLTNSLKIFKNIKVVIDSNNYKDSREKSLRDLARKKGKKVLETKRYVKLNPMSARERKIIHEEISHMKGLKTESQGEEPKRYLVIKPLEN